MSSPNIRGITYGLLNVTEIKTSDLEFSGICPKGIGTHVTQRTNDWHWSH